MSTAGGLGLTGSADDGEVEDHEIEINPPASASGVFGDQKTMGEARRNVELRKALGRQDNGDMLSEVGRAPPHVDRHVVHLAFHDTNELALWKGRLQVESTQDPLARARVVVLYEGRRDPARSVLVGVVGLEKEAPVVSVYVRFDQDHAGQLGLREVQASDSASASRRRY